MRKPFLPSDLSPRMQLKDWRRSVTVGAIAAITKRYADQIAREMYGHEGPDMVAKVAVNPATTGGWGQPLVGANRVGAFLKSLRTRSAAAVLFENAMEFDFSRSPTVSLPRQAAGYPAPQWIAEGAPIPVLTGALGSDLLGPTRKLAAMTGITEELQNYSAENAEQIIEDIMLDAAARALDVSVFGNLAATSTRPAGILNGVSPIAASGSLKKDIGALFGAIAAAGAAGNGIWIFASPELASAAVVEAPQVPVWPAPVLAAGTVIAIDPLAFAYGFDDLPTVEFSRDAVIHWDDATPLAIGTAGSPSTVAAPVRSGFQHQILSVRMIIRTAWIMRLAGAVQYITGATW